jgi:hypothetical protein
MTEPIASTQENKVSDKELNFRKLEAHYQKQLHDANVAREHAEKIAQEAMKKPIHEEEETDPYVDHKKLDKKLAKFGEQNKQQTQSEIQKAVQTAIYEERKQTWIKQNGDFYDVLQHAEKLAMHDPELADTILELPDNFERQKLVYKNIKALGLNKEPVKVPSIQEKIDANRKSPYYQPSTVGTNPYASNSDFSPTGQKQAYAKMQELKNRLRI